MLKSRRGAGRPRLDPVHRKGSGGRLVIGLSESESKLISAAAEVAGQRPTAFARNCVMEYLHSGHRPVEQAEALNKKYAELARTAANLNQLTHHLNLLGIEAGTPEFMTKFTEIIIQLRDDLTEVRDAMRFNGGRL